MESRQLTVRTLGDFTITWGGRQISTGSRDSQFARLMGILLHYAEHGVERGRLEDMLFEDSSSLDPHHMLRSVIYNTKKKLEKSGLPPGCIQFRSGIYRWTDQIPVVEDARVFEALVAQADAAEGEERIALLHDAVMHYLGEFLPEQTRHVWVIQEERRYQDMFSRCVEELVDRCRETHDYAEMEKLGVYAAKVQPLEDWETVTMEALLGLQKYQEASDLYERTTDLYMEELGVRPAFAGTNVLEQIAFQMENQYSMIDEIQEFLREEDADVHGGYLCSLPIFQGIYRMIGRMISRGGQSVYLMLCTIVNGKGQPMREGAVLNRLSVELAEVICQSVRYGDVVCKYNKNQYLVLLVNTTREDCAIVEERIDRKFSAGGKRTGVKYRIKNVDGIFL